MCRLFLKNLLYKENIKYIILELIFSSERIKNLLYIFKSIQMANNYAKHERIPSTNNSVDEMSKIKICTDLLAKRMQGVYICIL